ncbi:MAG: hypothetical protein KDA76_00750 [Planctomycetaceae bacterium]|nr:hypothetical protein [Planctomycetaceae bacterium]
MAETGELQHPKYVDFGEYILFQLQRTRGLIRQTDVLLLATGTATVVLFWLFVFVLLDHWMFAQGLSHLLRWLAFTGLLASVCGPLIYFLKTSAGKDVTSLYAARTLEQNDHRLRNTLLTLADLEYHQRQPTPLIRGSLEKRAALALHELDIDQAVDRRLLLRLLHALLACTLLWLGYALLSQKSVGESLYRLLLPWTITSAPTQTKILDVKPGSVTVTSGTHVEVSAFIEGKIPEQVWLIYTTADRRLVNERIPLYESGEGLGRHRGIITGENGRGVDQPTFYFLEAGDGQTETFQLAVKAAPHASLRELTLTPPAYTQHPPRVQQNGAIDAIEGTRVELSARTNIPVNKAWIQLFNSEDLTDRAGQIPVNIEAGQDLSGSWALKIRDDGTYPRFYRIECETEDGSRESAPPLHAILVRQDLRPEVRLLDPTRDLERPVNATVPLLIEAYDPDFRLSGLSVQVELQGEIISSELIDARNRQSLRVKHPLELSRLPVQAGDEISFWIEARDNREPHANRRGTAKQRIRLTDPVSREQAEQQRREDEQRQQEQKAREETPPQLSDPSREPSAPDEEPQMSQPEGADQPQKDDGEAESSDPPGKAPKGQEKSGEGQTSDKPAPQDQPGKEPSDQEQPSEDQGKPSDEPKFSPDGQDDDRVLEKLIEKLKDQEQKSGENTRPDPQGQEQPESPHPDPNGKSEENGEQRPRNEGMPDTKGVTDPNQSPADDGQGKSDKNEMQDKPSNSEESPSKPASDSAAPGDESQEKGKEPAAGGDQTADERAGKTPKQTGEKEAGTQPGPGDKPTSDGEGPAEKNTQKKPGDADMQNKQPGKQPGTGESQPGTGKEQGPTERETDPSKGGPQAEKPLERPDTGKPSGDSTKQEGSGKKPTKDSPSGEKRDTSDTPSPQQGTQDGRREMDQPAGKEQQPSGESPQTDKPATESAAKPSGEKPDTSDQTPTMKESGKNGAETPDMPEQPESGAPAAQEKQGGDEGKAPGQDKGKGEGQGDSQGKGEGQSQGKGEGEGQGQGKSEGEGKGEGQGEGAGKPTGSQPGAGEGKEPSTDQIGQARGGKGAQPVGKDQQSTPGAADQGPSQATSDSIEDRKKAAELVLNKLEEDLKRGEVDETLLQELGWSKDNLKQFQQRMADYLRGQSNPDQPDLKQLQFEEMLKNMQLKGSRSTRTGPEGGAEARDEFAPTIKPAPPEYRELEQAFKRSLLESRPARP